MIFFKSFPVEYPGGGFFLGPDENAEASVISKLFAC